MNTATILVAFCALAVASALGGDMPEKMRTDFDKCVEDTGADPEILKKQWEDQSVVVVDDNTKCFHACMMKAHGMMKEDGTVDVAGGKANIPSDMAHHDQLIAAIDSCANEKGDNACDTANAIFICVGKNFKGPMAVIE